MGSPYLYDVNYLNLPYFFRWLYNLLRGGLPWSLETSGWWEIIFLSSLALSAVLAAAIIYFLVRIKQLQAADKAKYETIFLSDVEDKPLRNNRWENLLKYLESENESDWKLAILEADKLLDELVTKLGYPGENLGERLRAVEPADFKTLQQAWEAHKVRNRLAHEHGFKLSHREAKRVIELFAAVFREFNFI